MPKRQIYFTDFLIEATIPVLIIGLIWTVVAFAISIKGVFYPEQVQTLRIVFFLYVMGAVLVNRIAGYYGESEKAAMYSILLVGVMALFALTFSGRYGAIFGGADAGEGLWANLSLVVVIGLASYKIARESCLDIKDTETEKSAIQLKSELHAQRDWYRRMEQEEEQERKRLEEEEKENIPVPAHEPARLPRKHPGIWIIYFSLFSMVVFAVGQRLMPEDNFEFYARTFAYLAANLLCALALLLLTTLSALRFHCWEKKALVPPGMGWFWTLGGAALILVVVSLASLPPRPVPEYLARSIPAGYEFSGQYAEGEEGEKTKSNWTWGGLTKQIEMKLAKEQRDIPKTMEELKSMGKDEKGGTDEEEDEEGAGGGAQQADEEPSGDRTGSGKGESEETGSKQADRSRQAGQRARIKRPPLPAAPLQAVETLGRVIFIILAGLGMLWAFAKMLASVGKSNPLKRISAGFKGLAARLRSLLTAERKPRLPKKELLAALKEENLYMENPFRDRALLKTMSTAALVSYTYKAFENYSHAQGHTPSQGQTPFEFVGSLPEELRAEEFSTLAKLLMVAEYSTHGVPDKSIKNLKQVWKKIDA